MDNIKVRMSESYTRYFVSINKTFLLSMLLHYSDLLIKPKHVLFAGGNQSSNLLSYNYLTNTSTLSIERFR